LRHSLKDGHCFGRHKMAFLTGLTGQKPIGASTVGKLAQWSCCLRHCGSPAGPTTNAAGLGVSGHWSGSMLSLHIAFWLQIVEISHRFLRKWRRLKNCALAVL
jgi:hypothetical protein